MPIFENILVGVDLSKGDWLASDSEEASSHEACLQAAQIAEATGAKLHFLAALDLDERTKRLLKESGSEDDNVLGMAKKALRHALDAAVKEGTRATSSVALGRGRTELADWAKANGHDLIVIGTRHHSALSTMFLGSTSLELLRTSPCPVWVAEPGMPPVPKKILVATNFSPVCQALVEKSAELAKLFSAELHVVHVVETHRRSFLQFSSVPSETVEASHCKQTEEGRKGLDDLLTRPAMASLQTPPTLHLLEGKPSEVVHKLITTLDIDLLLMGTVAWSGVPGLVMGSTAQNLLPHLTCSLLTMRADAGQPGLVPN